MLNVDSVLPVTSCELLLLEFTSAGADDRDGAAVRIQTGVLHLNVMPFAMTRQYSVFRRAFCTMNENRFGLLISKQTAIFKRELSLSRQSIVEIVASDYRYHSCGKT